MPAFVSFDLGIEHFLHSPGYYTNKGLYHPDSEFQFLEQKDFVTFLCSLQTREELQCPPSPAESVTQSNFDHVPFEILDQILGSIHNDTSRGIYDVLRDISACSLVSRQFYAVAVNWLYRHVPISDPYAFTKVFCP